MANIKHTVEIHLNLNSWERPSWLYRDIHDHLASDEIYSVIQEDYTQQNKHQIIIELDVDEDKPIDFVEYVVQMALKDGETAEITYPDGRKISIDDDVNARPTI